MKLTYIQAILILAIPLFGHCEGIDNTRDQETLASTGRFKHLGSKIQPADDASPDSVPAASLKDSGSYLQYIDQIFPLENQNKAKLIPRAKDGKKDVAGPGPDTCINHREPCRGAGLKLSEECCGFPTWRCMKGKGASYICNKPDYYGDGLAWPSGYTGSQTRPKKVSTSTVQEDQPAVQARQVSTAVLAEEKSAKDSEESHKEDGSLDGIDIESHPAPNAAERIAKIFRRYDIIRKCHQAKDRCRNDEQCCTNLECVRAKSSDKYGRCKNVEIW